MMFRRNGVKQVSLEEVSCIAGSDWTTVWRKLQIVPQVNGEVLIGELMISGKPILPIIARLGAGTRSEVVEGLGRCLRLSESDSLDFLRCHLGRASVITSLEEDLLSYDEDSSLWEQGED